MSAANPTDEQHAATVAEAIDALWVGCTPRPKPYSVEELVETLLDMLHHNVEVATLALPQLTEPGAAAVVRNWLLDQEQFAERKLQ